MSISYPTSLDTLTNPTSSDDLDTAGVLHDIEHADANDAVEALEAKVGVDGSAVITSLDYRVRGVASIPFVASGVDDLFDDESFSGWTAVNSGSHTVTVTEKNRSLSLAHPGGDASAELHAWMKAHTFSVGDYFETRVKGWGHSQTYNIAGLIFADGTSYGSGRQSIWYFTPNEGGMSYGEITGYNTSAGVSLQDTQGSAAPQDVFLRYKWNGSGVCQGYVSPDGISWVATHSTQTVNGGSFSPTHVGFFITTWSGTSPFVWNFKFFHAGS